MANRGESPITMRASNTSTANPESGKGYVMQPMPVPHSARNARRTAQYHAAIEPSYVRPSSTKMTQAEHQLNNDEDMSEKGHKL